MRQVIIQLVMAVALTTTIYAQAAAPVISFSVQDTTIFVGDIIRGSVVAKGWTGNPLRTTLVAMPDGASFDTVTSRFQWTPQVPQIGKFVFSAEDGIGKTVSDVIVVVWGDLFYPTVGVELADSLRRHFAPSQTLGYDLARDSMYALLHLDSDGFIRGIYTGYAVELTAGDPSTVMFNGGINTAHIWPQSKGAAEEPQKSDLYNLAPAKSNVNSSRGDKPFRQILDNEVENWYRLDEVLQQIPTEQIDEYSESTPGRWEPREAVKGDVARAVDYFFLMYPHVADSAFFRQHLPYIQDWIGDRPTFEEYRRALKIADWQGNINPFLIDPDLHSKLHGLIEAIDDDQPMPTEFELKVAPNPATTRITVSIATQSLRAQAQLRIYDILGRTVSASTTVQPFSGHAYTLDTGHLVSGIYFVVLNLENRVVSRPFIVQR